MKKAQKFLRSLMVEIAIYVVLVTAYFFLVLHFLSGWLKDIYDGNRLLYAVATLALIVGQGVLLEVVTTKLLGFLRSRME